jgi:hypothetical protein
MIILKEKIAGYISGAMASFSTSLNCPTHVMELTGTGPRGYIKRENGVPMTNLELTMEHTVIEDDYKRKVS